MAIYRYPPEVHEFVKKWAPQLRDDELADACNMELGTDFTASGMKAFRGNHGYRNYRKQWTSEEYWKYQKRWPQGMYEFIRDNSWGVSSEEMAKIVNEKFGTNFTRQRMKCFRAQNHIKSGVTGWFQRGHSPGNKGKKIDEYMSLETCEKVRATTFKKGNIPANHLPVGTERITKDKYRIVKVQDEGELWDRWKFVHRLVWEEANGPVPEDCCICFKDGNHLNCDLDNLVLIKRSELATMIKKGYLSEDPDATMAGLAVVKLMRAAKEKRKRGNKT